MQQADLVLLNGAGYENWIETVTLRRTKLVDTSAGFSERWMKVDGAITHSHGPEGAHAHTGTAFTTWIDFTQAAEQANAIKTALIATKLASEAKLAANYEALRAELLVLDTSLRDLAAGYAGAPLISSHPIYHYFARRYGLNIRSVHWEPDSVPTKQMWAELATLRAHHPAEWMIWEAAPLAATVAKLEEIGVRSVVFDPCGNRPISGDFMSVMHDNIANFRAVFREGG